MARSIIRIVIIRCRKYFVRLIFVALCDYENFSTMKISRFTVGREHQEQCYLKRWSLAENFLLTHYEELDGFITYKCGYPGRVSHGTLAASFFHSGVISLCLKSDANRMLRKGNTAFLDYHVFIYHSIEKSKTTLSSNYISS